MEPDSEQKAEASFLLRAGNLAAGTFNANVRAPPPLLPSLFPALARLASACCHSLALC